MESVTTSIVTALVAGAVAGLKPMVSQAVKDGYERLKALIKRKYSNVSIDQLEADPTSKARRAVVEEDLQKTEVEKDPELLQQVKALLDAIQSQPPEVVSAIGVDLHDIKGASLTIEDVTASGTGVKADKIETSGDITIRGVRAGGSGEGSPN
jgi:disulfide oxidoreductase YuzD